MKSKLFPGAWTIAHVCFAGMLFQGIPHTLYAFAQQWVSSSLAQLMRPLSPIMGAIFSHFMLPDERFTKKKFISLVLAITGVSLTSIPTFTDKTSDKSLSQKIIGIVLLFFAISFTGIALVYMKMKTKGVDQSVQGVYQMFASGMFCVVWTLSQDGPHITSKVNFNLSFSIWIIPILVGITASGLSVHGSLYLIDKIGAVGTSFTKFGQIIVGVAAGVVLMKEWAGYSHVEIIISVIGIIILSIGILVEFVIKDPPKPSDPNSSLLIDDTYQDISIMDDYTEQTRTSK